MGNLVPRVFPSKGGPAHPFFEGKVLGTRLPILYALIFSGPPTFEKLLRGPRLGDSFHLSPVRGYRRENHGDRCPDDGFKGGSIGFVFVVVVFVVFSGPIPPKFKQ